MYFKESIERDTGGVLRLADDHKLMHNIVKDWLLLHVPEGDLPAKFRLSSSDLLSVQHTHGKLSILAGLPRKLVIDKKGDVSSEGVFFM